MKHINFEEFVKGFSTEFKRDFKSDMKFMNIIPDDEINSMNIIELTELWLRVFKNADMHDLSKDEQRAMLRIRRKVICVSLKIVYTADPDNYEDYNIRNRIVDDYQIIYK